MSPLMITKYLKMKYIFSVPHYLACGWFLVQIFLFFVSSFMFYQSSGEEKKKKSSGHTVQNRFDRQKELKKWFRNEVLEQHEAEAEVRL